MSMIASVLQLDRKAIQTLRVTDIYSLHRVVYGLYPDVRGDGEKQTSQSSGILFADQGGDFLHRRILLLANRPPRDQVDGQFGQLVSKPIPDTFLEHDHYHFKVIVNPTSRNGASRKLIPVRGRDAIADWFRQRAGESWGFHVPTEHLQIDQINVLRFKDKQQHPVTLAQAHVQGRITVTDRTQFRNSFAHGVGRGRAFGCGLLQIVPATDNPFA